MSPKGPIPPVISTKLIAGRVSQVRTLTPDFTVDTIIMPPKSPKLVILSIILPKRGIPP